MKKYSLNYIHYPSSNKHSIVCIHGILSDSRIFNNISILSNEGFDVYAIDLPGYGKSEGEKGNVSFDDVIASLHEFTKTINNVFLLGFSLGTIYAAYYASIHKVNGLILASSLLHPINTQLPKYATYLYKLYQENPNGRINILNYLNINDKYDYLNNDPLCNKEYTLSYIAELFLKATNVTIYDKINVPVLMLHGTNDIFTDVKQSEHVIRLLASNDKTLITLDTDHWLYDTFYYTYSKNPIVITIIKKWLNERL